MIYTLCVCPVWASLFYSNIKYSFRGCKSLMSRDNPSTIAQDRLFEPLVSRKVANREIRTEEGRAFKKCLVDIFSE